MRAALVMVAALVFSMVVVPAANAAAPSALRAGHTLGGYLRSPNGAYTAVVTTRGRFVLRHHRTAIWATRTSGRHARLVLRPQGDLVLRSGSRVLWASHTAGSRATRLTLGNNGVLALRSSGGVAWTNHSGNGCVGGAGRRILIGLTRQFARFCAGSQQLLATPITSGASSYGYGTPTGTWHLQDKQRERYLYPAAGGAYYVHYWLPYDGAYGMHDSSWQHFPYGSDRYRTEGSHGCVHFPLAAMGYVYQHASIGTVVQIRA